MDIAIAGREEFKAILRGMELYEYTEDYLTTLKYAHQATIFECAATAAQAREYHESQSIDMPAGSSWLTESATFDTLMEMTQKNKSVVTGKIGEIVKKIWAVLKRIFKALVKKLATFGEAAKKGGSELMKKVKNAQLDAAILKDLEVWNSANGAKGKSTNKVWEVYASTSLTVTKSPFKSADQALSILKSYAAGNTASIPDGEYTIQIDKSKASSILDALEGAVDINAGDASGEAVTKIAEFQKKVAQFVNAINAAIANHNEAAALIGRIDNMGAKAQEKVKDANTKQFRKKEAKDKKDGKDEEIKESKEEDKEDKKDEKEDKSDKDED